MTRRKIMIYHKIKKFNKTIIFESRLIEILSICELSTRTKQFSLILISTWFFNLKKLILFFFFLSSLFIGTRYHMASRYLLRGIQDDHEGRSRLVPISSIRNLKFFQHYWREKHVHRYLIIYREISISLYTFYQF